MSLKLRELRKEAEQIDVEISKIAFSIVELSNKRQAIEDKIESELKQQEANRLRSFRVISMTSALPGKSNY